MKSLKRVTLVDANTVSKELETSTSIQKRGKYALNIPSRIRAEVGKNALCYGTQAVRKHFSSKYYFAILFHNINSRKIPQITGRKM